MAAILVHKNSEGKAGKPNCAALLNMKYRQYTTVSRKTNKIALDVLKFY